MIDSPPHHVSSPLSILADIFSAHGLEGSVHRGWLLPLNEMPCITADWLRRDERMGSLAVVAALADRREIIEVFPGLGSEDRDGVAYAFEAFMDGSLHVMLSALWNRPSEEDVSVQRWRIQGRDYDVFLGQLQLRGSGLEAAGLEDAVRGSIEALPLEADVHWFRFFVGHIHGDFTFEALKDSHDWDEGMQLLRSQTWEAGEGYSSMRQFLMLRRCT